MSGRIWTAYLCEVRKALRKKSSIAGILLVVAAVGGASLLRPVSGDGAGDYEFISYAISMSLNLLGLLLLVTFSAGLVSSEVSNGSICLSLVRPVRRHEFVAAKILLAWSYAGAMVLAASGAAWGVAFAAGDLTGVSYGGEVLYTNMDMASCFVSGAALAMLPYFGVAAYGVFISTAIKSTAASIGAALGVWLLADLLKHPLHAGRFWFATYVDAPWQVFAGRCNGLDPSWWPDAGYIAATSIAWGILFAALAMWFLARRDLQA